MSGIDFEKVLTTVGEKGRYQTVMFMILCIPATLPVAFLAFSNVFTNATPDHWCKAPESYYSLNISENDLKLLTVPYTVRKNGELSYSKCFMYEENIFDILRILDHRLNNSKFENLNDDVLLAERVLSHPDWRIQLDEMTKNDTFKTMKCQNGWVYDQTYYDYTLTTQFNLVCDDNWWPGTGTALFYVGSLFGNVIFGWIADRWGRRQSILLMIVLEVFLSIATCFSRDFNTYLIMRAFGGFFFPSLYQIPFILGIEMMGPSHRTFAGILLSLFFAASMSILSLLAYLLRNWYSLSLAISFPFLLLFSYYWIIPESPRWLVSQGRLIEAERILQKIAYYNGTKIPRGYLQHLQDIAIAKAKAAILEKNSSSDNIKEENYLQMSAINTTEDKNTSGDNNEGCKLNLRSTMPGNTKRVRNNVDKKFNKRPYTFPLENINSQGNNNFKDVNAKDKNNDNNKCDDDSSQSDLILGYHKPDIVKSNERPDQRRICDTISRAVDEPNRTLMKSVCLQTDPIPIMEQNEATLLDIFRYPNIRKKFFILTFDWIANAVVYNGLSYNATNLGVNDYLAFFISAIVEVPSYLLSWVFMERWGRRWTLCITLATGGIGCLSCMFVPEEQVWVTVGLAMLGKFGVAASFSVFYVFVGELFPTVVRSQAMGLASLLVSGGLLSFPYILQLGNISRVIPLIILGVLSLSGSVASIFLPETLNEPMPQTLEDGEAFGKDFKILSWPKKTGNSNR